MNLSNRKVLYITNCEVPYRSEYFNQLSKKVDLTVLYERKKSSNRNEKWSKSVKTNYKIKYLNGIKFRYECAFSFGIIKYIFSKEYTDVIFGCFNSPLQILGIILMKIRRKKYIINLDGEYFLDGKSIKKMVKRLIIKGASKYFVAGEKAGNKLKNILNNSNIFIYHFSSLTKNEILQNSKNPNKNINNSVIVVGQYRLYKGLDTALECAKLDQGISYKFIGSGNNSELLQKRVNELELKNIEVIPFLQKKELYKEYQECKCIILPSRKECWGLVINEASSFGCPIISTNGSGAAIEFLEKRWIVNIESSKELLTKIKELNRVDYNREQLLLKSKKYTIENNVEETIRMLEDGNE